MNNLWFASDLVCAVCKQKLFKKGNELYCSNGCCTAGYTNDGILYVLPRKSILQRNSKKINAWQIVQNLGALYYEKDPVNHLTIMGSPHEKYYREFGEFCRLSGKVLDIGCGPSGMMPVYLQNAYLIAGIDPIPGSPGKEIAFCQAVGEFLPFPNRYFDNVIMNSVLGHVFAPDLVIKEAMRVLVPSGRLHICVNNSPHTYINRVVRRFIKKRLPERVVLFLHQFKHEVPTPLYIPDGAEDFLHMECFNERRVLSLFSKTNAKIVNFKKVRIQEKRLLLLFISVQKK